LAPLRAGDTLKTTWTVAQLLGKPKHGGGVVVLTGTPTNQDDVLVAEADASILVSRRPH